MLNPVKSRLATKFPYLFSTELRTWIAKFIRATTPSVRKKFISNCYPERSKLERSCERCFFIFIFTFIMFSVFFFCLVFFFFICGRYHPACHLRNARPSSVPGVLKLIGEHLAGPDIITYIAS